MREHSFEEMFLLISFFIVASLQQIEDRTSVETTTNSLVGYYTGPTHPPNTPQPSFSSDCHNTSVWADRKTCPTTSYDLFVFLLLTSEAEVPDEHFKLISKILQPCIETENSKNNSYFTILSDNATMYARIPISVFADFTAAIASIQYQKVYWPSKEYLYGAMESFKMVNSLNQSGFQKVIYLITDAKAQDVNRTDSTFWQNFVDFANKNINPQINSMFRVIFTKTGLIEDTETQLLLDSVSDAGKEYFRYEYGDLLNRPNVSDDYGLCSPLPPSTLPSFPMPKVMSAVWIVLIALGGTFLCLFVTIVCMCTCCRRYCWCPDFGGINWRKNVGEQLRERISDETERFTIQVRGKRKPNSDYSTSFERDYGWRKNQQQNRIIDKWEVSSSDLQIFEEKLGAGAYAVVYKGHLKGIPPVAKVYPSMQLSYVLSNDANYVAVKTTHEYATNEERLEFLQEIHFMKQLEYHPHILSLIACSTAPNYPLILTEICELGDLLTLVRNLGLDYRNIANHIEFSDLVPIAWQISDALTFLSDKNIIHRDVAARNILVTKNKMAKLSDFGLCRYNKELFYHSRGGKLPIKWMAPESIEFAHFSTKSDVWVTNRHEKRVAVDRMKPNREEIYAQLLQRFSREISAVKAAREVNQFYATELLKQVLHSWSFGVLLYEMYSFGKTPFHSINQEEVLPSLKTGKRLELPESSPDWINNIVESCWKVDPVDRPEFSAIRQKFYREMEENSESYGYLHFSRNYYQTEPTREWETSKL